MHKCGLTRIYSHPARYSSKSSHLIDWVIIMLYSLNPSFRQFSRFEGGGDGYVLGLVMNGKGRLYVLGRMLMANVRT